MNDSIFISRIPFLTHIGVHDEERAQQQELTIDVELFLDTRKAGESDDVTQSVDYDAVVQAVQQLREKERKTIECLAEDIASAVLDGFAVEHVKVNVWKNAIPDCGPVSITIYRKKEES